MLAVLESHTMIVWMQIIITVELHVIIDYHNVQINIISYLHDVLHSVSVFF
jgi:hypothetical protein